MRVAFFGASGKVGRETLKELLTSNTVENLELILVAKNPTRIEGLVADIESITPLLGSTEKHTPVTIKIAREPKDIENVDLAIICAATWSTAQEKSDFKKIDPSGRLVQAHANFNLVQDISRQIVKYAPNATTIVVTNQSDLLAEAAREILNPKKVLGFGGMVDSTRFRHVASKIRNDLREDLKETHMIGYHNGDMIPGYNSLPDGLKNEPNLEKIISETRTYGSNVSKLQKNFNQPGVDSGASVLPGYALYKIISAWASGEELTESFNVRLNGNDATDYGVRDNSALSVPIRLKNGSCEVFPCVATPAQWPHLREAQKKMELLYEELRSTSVQNVTAFRAPTAKRKPL